MSAKKTIKKAHKKPSSRSDQSRYHMKKRRFSYRQRMHITMITSFILFVSVLCILVHAIVPKDVQQYGNQTEKIAETKKTTKKKKKKKVDTSNYPSVTVCIDPGHGGYDGGNVGVDGTVESTITIKYAKYFGEYLQEMNPNIKLVYTREDDNVSWDSDEDADLKARVQIADNANADYFISFHLNSSDVDSSLDNFEFFIRGDDSVSETIAENMAKNLHKVGWNYDYSITDVATYPLYVVTAQTKRPSLLFEVGYASNKKQEKEMIQTKNIKKIAKAAAKSYHEYILKHN